MTTATPSIAANGILPIGFHLILGADYDTFAVAYAVIDDLNLRTNFAGQPSISVASDGVAYRPAEPVDPPPDTSVPLPPFWPWQLAAKTGLYGFAEFADRPWTFAGFASLCDIFDTGHDPAEIVETLRASCPNRCLVASAPPELHFLPADYLWIIENVSGDNYKLACVRGGLPDRAFRLIEVPTHSEITWEDIAE
jgi:hypothetical protein